MMSRVLSWYLNNLLYLRAVPGKKVLGVELENWGTTNTILSFFIVQFIWIFQETPPTHRILIDFSSTPDAVFPGTSS